MARTTIDAMPAKAGLISSFLLVAASALLLALPDTAQAQSGGLPMSKAYRKSPPKVLGSCIVPAPGVTITPSSITFPGTTNAGPPCNPTPIGFTLTNSGTAPLNVNLLGLNTLPYEAANNFSITSNCNGSTFAPGASCNGTVSFCPAYSTSGTLTQSLIVYSNAPYGYSIPLTGTVTSTAPVPTPIFDYSPSELDFSTVLVGTSSSPQAVTISNSGTGPLVVTSASASGPFSIFSNSCSTVAPGDSCDIEVTYNASADGYQSGSLVIYYLAAGGDATVNLSGTGVSPPGIIVSPSTLYLGTAEWGVSNYNHVTVYNYGTAPITPSLAFVANVESYFSIDYDYCTDYTVPAGSSCEIGIRFDAPLYTDVFLDTLEIDIGATPYLVDLNANTQPPYPNISITPDSFDFGLVNIGSASACQTFVFTNNGPSPVIFDVLAPNVTPFPSAACATPTCAMTGMTLNPAQSCNVAYQFQPQYAGIVGNYLMASDAYYGPVSFDFIVGTGYQPGPRIAIDQYALDFGSQVIGTPAPNQVLTVSNIGDLPMQILGHAPPGAAEFSVVSDGCAPYPRTLSPSASCTVTYGFTPSAIQLYYDSATFNSNALNGANISVSLYGEGVAVPTPSADFFPMSLDFGSLGVGSTSTPQAVSFANTGSAPMSISSIVHSGAYTVTHDCPLAPATMAAGTCCTIQATFNPTAGGTLTDAILVATNVPSAGPYSIPLTGIGIPPPSLTATPASVAFPDQIVGTTSAAFQVVFQNTGITNVVLGSLNYAGDFSLTAPPVPAAAVADGAKRATKTGAKSARPKATALPACAGTLAVGASCAAVVYFTPTALGLRSGALSLSFTGGVGSPKVVALSGYGVSPNAPGISLSADLVDFGGVVVNTASPRSVTVTSSGNGPLDVLGARALGAFFSASTTCGMGIAPGASCSVTVTCLPTSLTRAEGDLYVDHSATGGFRNVHLVCTGITAPVPKILVSATGVGFGNQSLGTASAITEVQISSVGTAPLALGTMTTLRPFAFTTDCPVTLQPGLSCKAKLTFTPLSGGSQSGILTIPSNDPGKLNWVVNLNGTGCRPFSVQGARRGTGACTF